MSKMHSYLSRKNIYALAFILILVGIVIYAFFPKIREIIYVVTFNPFWPVALGILEIYLQSKEKEMARTNEKKIDALSGVIRGRIENKNERVLIKSILDSMKDINLLEYSQEIIKQEELLERIEASGKIEGKSSDLNV